MRIIYFGLILVLLSIGQAGCSGEPATNSPAPGPTTDVNAISASQFTDANAALAEGGRLLDLGETDKAIEILNQAVTLNPDLAEAYFKLGIAYSLIEIRDKSIEETNEAATPTPEPTGKKGKEKEVKTESEKAFEKAVEAYKKIIDANDQDHVAYYNLGRSYNKLNEDQDAAKALRQAVKLNPEDTDYQTELGAILVKLAQYQEAITPLKKALDLDPGNSRAAELLDDAEAGRRRIDFAVKSQEEKKQAKTDEAANSNSETPDSNGTKPPANTAPKPPAATPKPDR
jgi:tetratricopeptide (TPR) repeat protein